MSLYEVERKITYLIYPSGSRSSSQSEVEKRVSSSIVKYCADVVREVIIFCAAVDKKQLTKDVAISRNVCCRLFPAQCLCLFVCV